MSDKTFKLTIHLIGGAELAVDPLSEEDAATIYDLLGDDGAKLKLPAGDLAYLLPVDRINYITATETSN